MAYERNCSFIMLQATWYPEREGASEILPSLDAHARAGLRGSETTTELRTPTAKRKALRNVRARTRTPDPTSPSASVTMICL